MNSKISYYFNEKSYELDITRRISFLEEEALIDDVAASLFDEDETYHPSRMDYYFWSMILGKYTNFDFDKYSANEIYAIIDDSNIKSAIVDYISDNQFHRMLRSIDEIVQMRLNKHPLTDIMKIVRNTFADGSDFFKKLLSDDSFRSQLTEYINNNDQAALIGALNSAAYKNE